MGATGIGADNKGSNESQSSDESSGSASGLLLHALMTANRVNDPHMVPPMQNSSNQGMATNIPDEQNLVSSLSLPSIMSTSEPLAMNYEEQREQQESFNNRGSKLDLLTSVLNATSEPKRSPRRNNIYNFSSLPSSLSSSSAVTTVAVPSGSAPGGVSDSGSGHVRAHTSPTEFITLPALIHGPAKGHSYNSFPSMKPPPSQSTSLPNILSTTVNHSLAHSVNPFTYSASLPSLSSQDSLNAAISEDRSYQKLSKIVLPPSSSASSTTVSSSTTSSLHSQLSQQILSQYGRSRTRISSVAVAEFEHVYSITTHPSRERLTELANKYGEDLTRVKVWFNNRRGKSARERRLRGKRGRLEQEIDEAFAESIVIPSSSLSSPSPSLSPSSSILTASKGAVTKEGRMDEREMSFDELRADGNEIILALLERIEILKNIIVQMREQHESEILAGGTHQSTFTPTAAASNASTEDMYTDEVRDKNERRKSSGSTGMTTGLATPGPSRDASEMSIFVRDGSIYDETVVRRGSFSSITADRKRKCSVRSDEGDIREESEAEMMDEVL